MLNPTVGTHRPTLRHSVLPSTAATWQGVSPCLAAVVGDWSVNLSNHLREKKIFLCYKYNRCKKVGGAHGAGVNTQHLALFPSF